MVDVEQARNRLRTVRSLQQTLAANIQNPTQRTDFVAEQWTLSLAHFCCCLCGFRGPA